MEVTPGSLAGIIDHTLLRPDATGGGIERLCSEAVRFGFFSVCVNPVRVSLAARLLEGSGVLVCSVAGFPLGASACKAAEAARAVSEGASEIDMVMDLGTLRDGDPMKVSADAASVVKASEGRPVKVIIETCLLTDDEKRLACRICRDVGAAFVKTSTGFSSSGASVHDVRLLRAEAGTTLKVKASGGIGSLDMALEMVAAGADRLGTSRSVEIMGEIVARAAGGVVQPPAWGPGSSCS
jgi:deoxyribose-phosphate aldolase